MSLDYPDRADWLRARKSPKRRYAKRLHLSAPLIHVRAEDGTTRTLVGKGTTYRKVLA